MNNTYSVKYKGKPYDFSNGEKTLLENNLILIARDTPFAYEYYVWPAGTAEELMNTSPKKATACAIFHKESSILRLRTVFTNPSYRHMGLATYLICLGLKRACELGIHENIPLLDASDIPGFYNKYTFMNGYHIGDNYTY